MDEDLFESLAEYLGGTEVHVIAKGFLGQVGVQGMVHIVIPLAVDAQATGLAG